MFKKPKTENVIFIIYSILLVWVVIFKTSFSIGEFLSLAGQRSVNLIPFSFLEESTKLQLKETIMNFFAFIPLGIYLPMIKVSAKRTILYGASLSLIFEILQFIFAIGICDVTDLITNTVGACIGTCIYFILIKFFPAEKVHRAIKRISIFLLSAFFILLLLLIIANFPTQPTVC